MIFINFSFGFASTDILEGEGDTVSRQTTIADIFAYLLGCGGIVNQVEMHLP